MPGAASINYVKLAHEVTRARRKAGMTTREAGAIAGVSASMISRTETGLLSRPQARVFGGLCGFVKMPPAAFLFENIDKIVHYSTASLSAKIRAILYADLALSDEARDALCDLMEVAIKEVS